MTHSMQRQENWLVRRLRQDCNMLIKCINQIFALLLVLLGFDLTLPSLRALTYPLQILFIALFALSFLGLFLGIIAKLIIYVFILLKKIRGV